MIYSSLEFLLVFPPFCLIYWLARAQRLRLGFLLIGSAAFYAYGEPMGLTVLLGVTLIGYLSGRAISAWRTKTVLVTAAAVTGLLIELALFKYAGFLASVIGAPGSSGVVAPLGISFFTFEAISYVVDRKRGIVPAERSLAHFSLFVGVFPHLISGPIMRAGRFLPQLQRQITWHFPVFLSGLQLFVEGMAKKVVVADPAGRVADRVFGSASTAGTVDAWLGALAYTVQIYGDFAGYTDMGRGIARMLGLELPLNFDLPYAANSVSDFWRRWHISLSSWLRDYLYIPLGGNRRGSARTYANLIFTMLLGGLWHGAGWTFVAWGGYHGLLLAIERRIGSVWHVPRIVAGAVTLFLIVNGWVLFRAQSFDSYWLLASAMYSFQPGTTPPLIGPRSVLLVAGLFAATVGLMTAMRLVPRIAELARNRNGASGVAYGLVAAVSLVIVLTTSTPAPFIYFRF